MGHASPCFAQFLRPPLPHLTICTIREHWVLPDPVLSNQLTGFFRSPGARLVGIKGSYISKNWFHDSPLLLDDILASKQFLDASARVVKESLVRMGIFCRLTMHLKFYVAPHHTFSGNFDSYSKTDHDIRPQSNPHVR